jgi:hypothetical protein
LPLLSFDLPTNTICPSCPNRLLTDWHIQVCLHNDAQIRRHNNIVDYNVSLLHSLQRTALLEPNAGLGKYAYDIQTDHLPPKPPNSGSLLLDCAITSPVQHWFLVSNTNLRNCKPLKAATNAFNRKINKYKDLLQLQPPGAKFLPLAIESLGGTDPKVRNFLLQLDQCASRLLLLSALQSYASFIAYHVQALSVLTYVGTANSIVDLAKKANTTFSLFFHIFSYILFFVSSLRQTSGSARRIKSVLQPKSFSQKALMLLE